MPGILLVILCPTCNGKFCILTTSDRVIDDTAHDIANYLLGGAKLRIVTTENGNEMAWCSCEGNS